MSLTNKMAAAAAFSGLILTTACGKPSENICVNTGAEIRIISPEGDILQRGDVINKQMNSKGTIIRLEAIDLNDEARSFSFKSDRTNGQSSCNVTVGQDTVSFKARDKSGFTNPIPN
jgi:hypothetical protein